MGFQRYVLSGLFLIIFSYYTYIYKIVPINIYTFQMLLVHIFLVDPIRWSTICLLLFISKIRNFINSKFTQSEDSIIFTFFRRIPNGRKSLKAEMQFFFLQNQISALQIIFQRLEIRKLRFGGRDPTTITN